MLRAERVLEVSDLALFQGTDWNITAMVANNGSVAYQ